MSNIKCESCPFHDNCVSKNLFAYCAFSDIDEDKTQMVAAELETEEDSSYLYEFIFEACEYFSSAGYICNSSEIFSVISDIHESVDVKRLLSTMLAHNYQESAAFDKIYDEFLEKYYHRHREEREAKDSYEKKKKKISEQLQHLTGKQNELMQQKEDGQKDSKEIKKAEQTEEQQK